jgi:hypothetical protein
MSEPALETLSAIAAAAKRYAAGFPSQQVPPRPFLATAAQLAKLTSELASVPEVRAVEGRNFSTPALTAPLNVGFLASSLVERISDGTSATSALNDLVDLLTRKNAPIYLLKGLVGITVNGVVELSDSVAVMPANRAPPSRAREEIFHVGRNGQQIFRRSVIDVSSPHVALIIRDESTVILDSEPNWKERSKLTERMIREEESALMALTLSGPECAPFVVLSSAVIDHPAYPYSGFGHEGYATYPGTAPAKNGDADADFVKTIYGGLQQLREKNRGPILRATDRLRRSRSHRSAVDQAIDLGIALEMIFLHDQSGTTELRYRAAVRAARFLGKDGVGRRRMFDSIKAAYDARSKAVHTGELTDKSLIDNLPVADQICAEAIRCVIDHGGFPADWEALVIEDQASE